MIEPGTITTNRPKTPGELHATYGEYLKNPNLPRPDRSSHGKFTSDAELAKLQGQWEAANGERERVSKWVASNKALEAAKAKAAADARQAERDAIAKANADQFEARVRKQYLSTPGATTALWESKKDEYLEAERLRMVHADSTADDIVRRQASRENRARF